MSQPPDSQSHAAHALVRSSSRVILIPLLVALALAAQSSRPAAFNVVEASIPEMVAAMKNGRVTSRRLVELYLIRIAGYENILHATITVNPRALAEADVLDQERAQGKLRGPLHGVPIALKDNILTRDLVTTGGALAFSGYMPPYDATLVKNLHDAGAIILAKTTLSELAGYVGGPPSSAPGNHNAVRGFAYNPYDPRPDPRPGNDDGRPALTPAGSSSGSGTAANFWAANVGTETSGSILGPSNVSMLAAIKPTVGRVSRYGVIPLTADQDTAGPMAKWVADTAILLGAMEGAKPDPNDAATTRCTPPPNRDYTTFLKSDGLKGARIGIPRAFYYNPLPGAAGGGRAGGRGGRGGGLNPDQAKLMAEAVEVLKKAGAVIVDPADIPSIRESSSFNFCSGADARRGHDSNCTVVVKYGVKRDFNQFLATLGPTAPVKTLTELREWNITHMRAGAIIFGQSNLDISDEMNLETDRARYEADRAKDLYLSATHGIDEVMKANNLDALFFPSSSSAAIAAKPGYPTVTVPFGFVPNAPNPPFPEGFNAKPSPYGVGFTGMACSEPKLIELAYGFEQATKRRQPPPAFP